MLALKNAMILRRKTVKQATRNAQKWSWLAKTVTKVSLILPVAILLL
jgi:hypothetical protein